MLREVNVNIDAVKGTHNEYIIREDSGITIGRVFIIELVKENQFCYCRLKFYKHGEENYVYLKKALTLLLNSLFNNMKVFKVNILVDTNLDTKPFSDLGFELEGVITNSVITNNNYGDELLFGIDENIFKSNIRQRFLMIKGNRIDVRVLTPEDANDVLNYYVNNKKYLKAFEPIREENFFTLQNQYNNLTESYKQFLNGTNISMGIFKDKNIIGKIKISCIVLGVFKNAIVGYSIDEKEQGNGYMKEALNLVIKYAFEEMDLHRIEASTLINNIKSQNVLRGCGFKELGINEKYLYINGEWRDHITFYRLNEE